MHELQIASSWLEEGWKLRIRLWRRGTEVDRQGRGRTFLAPAWSVSAAGEDNETHIDGGSLRQRLE